MWTYLHKTHALLAYDVNFLLWTFECQGTQHQPWSTGSDIIEERLGRCPERDNCWFDAKANVSATRFFHDALGPFFMICSYTFIGSTSTIISFGLVPSSQVTTVIDLWSAWSLDGQRWRGFLVRRLVVVFVHHQEDPGRCLQEVHSKADGEWWWIIDIGM